MDIYPKIWKIDFSSILINDRFMQIFLNSNTKLSVNHNWYWVYNTVEFANYDISWMVKVSLAWKFFIILKLREKRKKMFLKSDNFFLICFFDKYTKIHV